ncbi:unnamed protein product [Rhizophagus irregularis]|nr:unnamed protein product [Rhizophagus irregularis]CAB5391016.1 unnamed protein product [Rhizophagus irregularis]
MSDYSHIRVVVGLDFGTTYSGFTYCHVSDDGNYATNDQWPGEMGQLKTNTLIKETVKSHWDGIASNDDDDSKYSEKDKGIMRECAHRAGLIKERESKNLQFTTEPEAAAIYCMENSLKVHDLNTPQTTFMVVDCGGGTVDLTTRKVLEGISQSFK